MNCQHHSRSGCCRNERKTTKKPNKMSYPDEIRDVLSYITKNYSKVSLYIDVMHVNDYVPHECVQKYWSSTMYMHQTEELQKVPSRNTTNHTSVSGERSV